MPDYYFFGSFRFCGRPNRERGRCLRGGYPRPAGSRNASAAVLFLSSCLRRAAALHRPQTAAEAQPRNIRRRVRTCLSQCGSRTLP
ncbi:MAG TPA: hypothetical protein DCW71_04610 [Alistipes sp.]|nr:hypothetical protein [Alistipes sp.]